MSSITYRMSGHTPEEKKASLKLVRESFLDEQDMIHEDFYDWQYLDNPLGKGNIIIAYDEDRAIGQIASIPCRYRILDRETTVSLTMNLCVSPDYRGKGIMREVLNRIHQVENSFPLSVGIPNQQSIKGHVNSGYYPLPLQFLIRPISPSNYFKNNIVRIPLKPFDVLWKKEKIETGTNIQEFTSLFDQKFDDLFNNGFSGCSIIQIRSSEFLNWRYRKNPRRKYVTFTATTNDGLLDGYIIIRSAEVFGKNIGLIMDLRLRSANSEAGRNLIFSALKYFWLSGVSFAIAVSFPSSYEYKLLRRGGFIVCPKRFRPHPFAVCWKILSPDVYFRDQLVNPLKWFYMFGDFETF
jgi:GNAT superfamily N-acetyltransferase